MATRKAKVWSQGRSGAVMIAALVAVALLPVPFWPISGSVWLVLTVGCLACPRPEYFQFDSPQEKNAKRAKILGKALITPSLRIYGFGAPGSAEDVQPATLWPPRRVSSWAAVTVAVAVALVEVVAAWPLWQFQPESGLMYLWRHPGASLLSIPFAYGIAQAAMHTARMTTDPDNPAPAAMWDPDQWPPALAADFADNLRPSLLRAAAVAANPALLCVPALAFAFQWQFGAPISWPHIAILAVLMSLCAAVLAATRTYVGLRLADWKEQQEKRRTWLLRWQSLPKAGTYPPTWLIDYQLPKDNPTHTAASFTIGVGGSFDLYEEAAPKLAPALGSDMILIVPLAAVDAEGKTIKGSVQYGGFSVIWSNVKLGPHPHLRADLDPATQRFAIRWAFTNAFKSLKLGRPEFVGHEPLHAADSERILIETQWRLAPGTTFDQVAAKAHQIQEKLDAPWLRVGRRMTPTGEPSEFVSILFGDHPDTVKIRLPRKHRRLIDEMDWAAWFRQSKLIGSTGNVPRLEHKDVNPRGILEMEFRTAEGVAFSEVRKALPALSSTSGYAYVAAETLDEANRFRLVAGKVDPLNDAYLFQDFWDHAMTGPTPGRPKIDWCVGVGADGEPLNFTWDGEEPHLLVAGSSGSGKAQPLTERIPVPVSDRFPTGWATIGELAEGDQVYAADGTVTEIIGLSEIVDDHDVYEITFDDGVTVSATASHLWKASSAAARQGDARDRRRDAVRGEAIGEVLADAAALRAKAAEFPPTAGGAVAELSDISGLSHTVVRHVIEATRLRSISAYTDTAKSDTVTSIRPVEVFDAQAAWPFLCDWAVRTGRVDEAPDLPADLAGEWLPVRDLAHRVVGRECTKSETASPRRTLLTSVPHRTEDRPIKRKTGAIRRVVHFYPINEFLVAAADHLASKVELPNRPPLETLVTTEEMASSVMTSDSRAERNWAVRVAAPFDGPDADLPIDPWLLGAWLGDGAARAGLLAVGDEDLDVMRSLVEVAWPTVDHYRHEANGLAKNELRLTKPDPDRCPYGHANWRQHANRPTRYCLDCRAPGGQAGSRWNVPFGDVLADAGLLRDKHIPAAYLRGSFKQRLSLLQGLMDTDGTISTTGNCEFSVVDERLANQTLELVRSLGIKAAITASDATITEADPDMPGVTRQRTCGTRYRIHFTTDLPVFRLPRKAERLPTSPRSTTRQRYVVSVTKIDTVPARCLRIAHPEHLYLANGFVPTHNSGVINSFLCQLFFNNTPEDVEVWMMEPKNELQAYADIAHVKRFVDGQTPGDSPWANAAALLDEARQEMHRRYQLFASHPEKPQKLSEARYIAAKEGPMPDGSPHPLSIPYQFVIIEECSNYFTPPSLKQFRVDWETVIYNVEEIARLARAAGIHLLVATQYPTNRTISPVLKQQCRRLGLKTNNQLASMVIIDEPGLEDIKVPGRGMMSYSKGYRGFRGFLMRRPDEDNPDAPDDRAGILNQLPKAQGRVFGSAGTSATAEAPAIDPGIWDEETVDV